MIDLDQSIRTRHSTRMSLPQPVPWALANEVLALAQCAPSNSNMQPWHMVFASGPPRDRLVNALLEEARSSGTQHSSPARVGPALPSRTGRSSLRVDGDFQSGGELRLARGNDLGRSLTGGRR